MAAKDNKGIAELAYVDELTALLNRRYFYNYIPLIISKAMAEKLPLALLMLDVDRFKKVNDSFGHLVGDNLLAEIGRVLKDEARESDIIVRYAGDEFIIVLPNTQLLEAKGIGLRFNRKMERYVFREMKGQKSIRCTLSIGISVAPGDGEDIESLVFKADQALYSSKRGGRNKVCDTTEILPEVAINAKLRVLFPPPRLIERDEAIAAAKEFLNEKRSNKGGFFIFEGETGVGKTAILEKLVDEFREKDENATLLNTKCSEQDSIQPYYRLLNMIRYHIQSLGSKAKGFIKGLSDEHKSVLVKFIPELKQLSSPISTQKPSDRPQGQILSEGLSDIIMNIAERQRLLLIIDDMHWLDGKTLEFLRRLAENDLRFISICGTYQKEQLTDSENKPSPLAKFLDSISTGLECFKKIELKPLTQRGISGLMQLLFPEIEVTEDSIKLIYQKTNGMPLLVEETLRSLIEAGFIFFGENKWFCKKFKDKDIAYSLDKMILKRFENMDEETKEILTTAAIIGEGFDSKVLNKIANLSESEALKLIDKAKEAHLINPLTPLSDDRFAFTSQKVHNLITKGIDEEKVKTLHQKIGGVFEEEYSDAPEAVLCELIYHYKMAKNMAKVSSLIKKINALETFPLDEVAEYFERKLKEKEEAVEIEFDRINTEMLLTVLGSFWRAAMNVSKYPAQTPSVIKSIDAFYEDLLPLFEKTTSVALTEYQNTLLINGEPFKPKRTGDVVIKNLLSLMVDTFAGEITIKNTLVKDEIAKFLRVLMRKDKNIDFPKELGKCGVKNIKVDKARYGRIKEDAEMQEKMLQSVLKNYITGNIKEISDFEMEKLKVLQENPQKVAETIASILKTGGGKIDVGELTEKFSQSILNMGKLLPADTGEKWSQYRESMEKIIENLTGPLKQFITESGLGVDADFIQKEIRKKIDASSAGLETKAARFLDELVENIEGPYMSVVEGLEREGREALIPLIYLLHRESLHSDPYDAHLLARIAAGLLQRLGTSALQRLQQELLDDRWYVIRNTIEVLGYVKEGVSPKTIEPFLKHKEQCIREEARLALERIRDFTSPAQNPHIEKA